MIKKTTCLRTSLTLSVLLMGCGAESLHPTSSADELEPSIDIEMKSAEEQAEVQNSYNYDDYKKAFDEVVQEAESYSLENEELEKWAIRTLVQEKLYFETDLTKEEVLQLAELDMRKDEAWKELAQEEYGFPVTEKEVDSYLEKFSLAVTKGTSKDHLKAYAHALGLTVEELLYEYDRDFAVKAVLWEKLTPILQEKYNSTEHNVLVEKYMDEVDSTLASSETVQINKE